MANRDRVSDLYYGRVRTLEEQSVCRDRVHWLCRHVVGERVLDIGCSQGIVSIILAREGHTVVGLDIEEDRVEDARRAIREEPIEVQNRATFHAGDAVTTELDPGSFDTAVLGEVLEHLVRPELLLDCVCRWLRPEGHLVISVPYGYSPYHDHKRTFFLLRLLDLLAPRFNVVQVELVHCKYLCAVAVRPAEGESPRMPPVEQVLAWIRMCEEELETVQRQAYEERMRLSARGEEYRQSITALKTQNNELRQQVQSAKTELESTCKREGAARDKIESEWRKRLGAAEGQLADARAELQRRREELKKAVAEGRRDAERLQANLRDETKARQSAERSCREETTRAETLQELLEAERSQAKAAQEQADRRTESLERDLSKIEAERSQREAAEEQANRLAESLERKVAALDKSLKSERSRREAAVESIQRGRRETSHRIEALDASLKTERSRRKEAEARAERLKGESEYHKSVVELREGEVRYRLGDAIVRALNPSVDTVLLPARVVRLLLDGLRRRRRRAREATEREGASPRRSTVSAGAAPAASAAPNKKPTSVTTAARREDDCARQRRAGPAKGSTGVGTGQGLVSRPPVAARLSKLDTIPELMPPFASTPPEQIVRGGLHIACVMDESSWRAWQYEADLYTFTPKTWQTVLEARKPDLLLIESTWGGIEDSWRFQVRDLGKRADVVEHYAIPDVIAWCRRHGIPTVFYGKEDPQNFEVFTDAAKQFDFVFTSDANCIEDYRKYVGHNRVCALPSAAQPRIHNPEMIGERTGAVGFAGTWYAHRHLQRQEEADKVLRPALDFGLHVFDRMANSQDPNFRWPDTYLPAMRGDLPYAQMLSAYKRYKVFLNINGVTDSPTMFPRRVFELLASGTPVISSYSEGIDRMLGGDIVLMTRDAKTTRELLERVLNDDEYRDRLSLRGLRSVFSEHTYTVRLNTILEAIGLTTTTVGLPEITVIAPIESAEQLDAAWENFRRQSYENKRLVLCTASPATLDTADRVTRGDRRVRVVCQENTLWGHLLRGVLDACEDGYLAVMNPRDHYGPHYLLDYAHATLHVGAPAMGKASYHASNDDGSLLPVGRGKEYRCVSQIHPWTLCFRKPQAVDGSPLLDSARSPWEWCDRAVRGFERIYSSDRFNYVRCEEDPGTSRSAPGAPHVHACAERSLETALV